MTAHLAAVPSGSRLQQCEAVIKRGLSTFIEVGEALLEIRQERLYLESHATFEEYCRERWGMADSRARQLISAVRTVAELESVTNVTVDSEGQARALAPVIRDLGAEAAAEILEEAAATGNVTASGITKAAKRRADLIAPQPTGQMIAYAQRRERERVERMEREDDIQRNLEWHQALATIEDRHHPVSLAQIKRIYEPIVYDYTPADMHRIADELHDIADRWDDA